MHGKTKLLKSLIANIHATLEHVKAAAVKSADRWATLLRYISNKIAARFAKFSESLGRPPKPAVRAPIHRSIYRGCGQSILPPPSIQGLSNKRIRSRLGTIYPYS
jgi:hypothetical protein